MTVFMNSFILLSFFRILIARGAIVPPNDEPCDYRDTVPLDPNTVRSDGSYLYNNKTIIPANRTYKYKYENLIGSTKHNLEKEDLRGCICDIKKCISICCPQGEEFTNKTCIKPQFLMDTHMNIIDEKGQIEAVDINEEFVLQYYRPCENLFHLIPAENGHHNFTINKDGSLYLIEEEHTYDKNQYCLSPYITDDYEFIYTALQCYLPSVDVEAIKMNSFALLISVPFMILTIVVYLLLPPLGSHHGLCLCCYLAGLCVGYSSLAYLNLNQGDSALLCSFLGYAAYFGFMSAFFWLSVISFDLYSNIYGCGTNQKMKQFRLYGLYAWGLALIFTICTYLAQNSSLPAAWKSGIGSEEYCFLNVMHQKGATLYFYGPMLIVVLLNTIMFVLTFNRIRINNSNANNCNSNQKQMDYKSLCWTFLRLFIIMGITWMAELIAFYTSNYTTNSWVRYVIRFTDIINGLQGLIIFLLFVCRKSVLQQLLQKFVKPSIDETRSEEMTTLQASKNHFNST